MVDNVNDLIQSEPKSLGKLVVGGCDGGMGGGVGGRLDKDASSPTCVFLGAPKSEDKNGGAKKFLCQFWVECAEGAERSQAQRVSKETYYSVKRDLLTPAEGAERSPVYISFATAREAAKVLRYPSIFYFCFYFYLLFRI